MTSSLLAVLGSSVQNKDGETVDFSSLKIDYLGLYFSAHWCPPCKTFTPKLAEFYKSFSKSKSFEVVFVSLDSSKREFESYYKEMPWLAIKFDEEDLKEDLKAKYDVEGIPHLVIVDAKTDKVVTMNGRNCIEKDSSGEKFPWSSS